MVKRLISSLMAASARSKRPVLSVALEMLRLRLGGARLGFSEYFDFRLYESDLSHAEKTQFAGWYLQGVLEDILIDDYARFLSLDKITMYTLLNGFGLAVPQLRAAYRSSRPSSLVQLNTEAQLAAYLQTPGATPVYVKPSLGSYGRGNTLVRDAAQDQLTLGDGSKISVQEFCRSLDDRHGLGWVLQEPLAPHASINAICGGKISGVRIHTFLSKDGPVVTKAIWKINVGKEDSDNFQHGASGNMLAALDIETGQVTRLVKGTGASQVVNPLHPVTGAVLLGFTLPWWSEIKALVCDAQLAFPGFICPGWDIAVCEDGPKILEVNYFGDIDLSQHAHRQGFLDDQFMALLRARGLDGLLEGAAAAQSRSPVNQRLGRRKHHWSW